MRIEFDDGTLLLRDAPENVPHAEWDDRVDEHRTQAYRYRALLEWAGAWTGSDDQATLRDGFGAACEDAARGYPDLELTPDVKGVSSSPLGAGRRSSGCRLSLTPA